MSYVNCGLMTYHFITQFYCSGYACSPSELLSTIDTCCCCLPTPMNLASGESLMFPLVVHQPASPSICPDVMCLCRGCDGCCVFCLYCEVWSCRCSCIGSVSVSSCRCCMFVSCVHPVAVLNAAFCMTCSLLMLVEDAIGDHSEEAYSRAGLITAL